MHHLSLIPRVYSMEALFQSRICKPLQRFPVQLLCYNPKSFSVTHIWVHSIDKDWQLGSIRCVAVLIYSNQFFLFYQLVILIGAKITCVIRYCVSAQAFENTCIFYEHKKLTYSHYACIWSHNIILLQKPHLARYGIGCETKSLFISFTFWCLWVMSRSLYLLLHLVVLVCC